jgi:hypothetical protein
MAHISSLNYISLYIWSLHIAALKPGFGERTGLTCPICTFWEDCNDDLITEEHVENLWCDCLQSEGKIITICFWESQICCLQIQSCDFTENMPEKDLSVLHFYYTFEMKVLILQWK